MPKTIRILSLLAATLLSGALLAACGGDDETTTDASATTSTTEASSEQLDGQEYADAVAAVLAPTGQNLTNLGQTISASTNVEELAASIGDAQEELQSSASELEALNPPEEGVQINQDLVDLFNGFADDLEPAQQAAEDGDEQALTSAAQKIPGDAQEFASQLQQIQQDAIDAGLPVQGGSGG